MNRCLFVAAISICMLMLRSTQAADALQARLAKAKPGQIIELPAGEFPGGAVVPPGVSVRGAGVGKTIIEASGRPFGLKVEAGNKSQISDLTIRNAQNTGVTVKNATTFTLARVRVTSCSNGISFSNVNHGRIENCISDHNSFGIAVSGGENCAVVNNTVANCAETGISLVGSPNLAAFNNCVIGSSVCLNIDLPDKMHIDHNLYVGSYLAQMNEQTPKRIMTAWNYLTGLDAHSVQFPVEFKDAVAGDFTPVNLLPWSLDRTATAGWGAAELAGVKAPTTDISGAPRDAHPDLGAIETPSKPPRPADGEFTISTDAGLKSAGVFTKDGTLVTYLFHNLPLSKGKYPFWLPARDQVGLPIPPGDYEVRLTASDFKWKYLNHVGDNGEDLPLERTASLDPKFVAFAPGGVLVMQEGPSEDHCGVRGYDVRTGKLLWCVNGTPLAQGIAVTNDGTVYVLGVHDLQKNQSRLTRLNSATGEVVPWPDAKIGHVYPATSSSSHSLAVLGDRLYVAAAEAGKVFVIKTSDGKVEKSFDAPSPRSVAGDEKIGVLWIASDNRLVAVTPDGKQIADATAVPDPLSVAACNGQLVAASGKTGKLHFFDASDPKNLKPLREIGRGDGPFGPIEPDRFHFQKSAGWQKPHESATKRHSLELGEASVALGPNGEVAVAEQRRVLAFDAAGKNLWYTIGIFGNLTRPSFSTGNRRMWDTYADISFLLNEKDATWKPEALWDHSLLTPEGRNLPSVQPIGDFSDGDKTFLVTASCTPGFPFGPPKVEKDVYLLSVSRLDGFKSVPVLTVTAEGDKAVIREDTNGDGRVTKEDAGRPLADAAGKPLPVNLFQRFNWLQADGSIAVMSYPPRFWKRTGLNTKGVPVYEGKDYVEMLASDWKKDLSPYDFKPDAMNLGGFGFVAPGQLSDGGWVFQVGLRGSGGAHLNNGAGTDLCCYGPDGHRRWVLPLAQHKGIAGMGTVDDITLTAVFYSVEMLAVDADGLGLGGFCEPQHLHYCGYWIDHPNLQFFKMPDGNLYATNGDNADGRHPWYRLENRQSLKRTKQPFKLADARAKELASSTPTATPSTNRSPQKFSVSRLNEPMTIDGGLEKWRKAGVRPQIVMGPNGAFKGAGDCSALIRMAYEGQNLYFQILQFDDKPVFYQLVQGQCVEMAINGAGDGGFQFVAYKNADGKDIVWRNRFFSGLPQTEFDPNHAPRIVKVLDDARDVTERETLESLYSVDLSKSKVIVTEFKLPLDKTTYAGAENDIVSLGSGKSFWIGFFVDDNDRPYTDVQKLIAWPATFGFFNAKEDGALAVCE